MKKGHFGDQIQDHRTEGASVYPEGSRVGQFTYVKPRIDKPSQLV